MSISLDIRLKRASKIYCDGEIVSGHLLLQTNSEFKHDGISLTMEGSIVHELCGKNLVILESVYSAVKPMQLVQYTLDVAPAGKIPSGKTEIPFELPLKPQTNKSLYETYHGYLINTRYMIRCDIKRNFLAKNVSKSLEFFVEDLNKGEPATQKKPVHFGIIPESLRNFKISGKFDSLECKLSEPMTGEVIIEQCEARIKSIELQLMRVEICGCAEGFARDATEVQNIQIGDGNVCAGFAIPIYMIFPRLFTCPTLNTSNIKVAFEVNVIILFEDDYLVTETFPVSLSRH